MQFERGANNSNYDVVKRLHKLQRLGWKLAKRWILYWVRTYAFVIQQPYANNNRNTYANIGTSLYSWHWSRKLCRAVFFLL